MKIKFKIILCILCIVAMISMISITVWALTDPEVRASFRIKFSGRASVQTMVDDKY